MLTQLVPCWYCGRAIQRDGHSFLLCACGATTVPLVITGPRNRLGGLKVRIGGGYAPRPPGVYVSAWGFEKAGGGLAILPQNSSPGALNEPLKSGDSQPSKRTPKRVRYLPLFTFKSNGSCLNCGGQLQGRRKKYCSDACADEFFQKHYWAGIRRRVIERDNYTCQVCARKVQDEKGNGTSWWDGTRWVGGVPDDFAEVDHIVPVSEGGAPLDEENCRTLCHRCHAGVTAANRRGQFKRRGQ